jgi:CRP-like cAMP-binding protein
MDIFENSKTKTVSKGTILLYKGDHCRAAYKVLKGCLRSYVIDKAGKEHILQFAPEDWYIGDMDSFVHDKPSAIFIDALEDSEVMFFGKEVLENLSQIEHPVLLAHHQKLVRNLIATHKRLIALLSATAEERYLTFIETYPALVQRLPLKFIASYLGITPEYLSEVRRKLMQKQ